MGGHTRRRHHPQSGGAGGCNARAARRTIWTIRPPATCCTATTSVSALEDRRAGPRGRLPGIARALAPRELFARVVQALIELAEGGSEERATLESIQNHVRTRGGASARRQESLL